MTESHESAVFSELMELAEERSPGFTEQWRAWADDLESPQTPTDPRSLITPELPYAIRGRGEILVTAEELNEDFYSEFDPGWYYTIHARQGGGNDECWCENDDDETHEDSCLWQNNQELRAHPAHVYDEYGDDSTYITHIFRVDASDSEVAKTQESERVENEQRHRLGAYERVLSGDMTPWAALNDEHGEFMMRQRLLQVALKHEADLAKVADRSAKLDAQAEAIAKLPQDFSVASVEALDIRPAPTQGYRIDFTANRFESALDRLKSSEQKIILAQQKLHDAETYLPASSPLRAELLTDRGTSSYQTTERRGRRNVKVTKTYDRGSVLGFELKNATRSHEDARKRILSALNDIVADGRKKNVAPIPRDIDPSNVILDALFKFGWEGPELPVVPSSFEVKMTSA